MGNPFGGGNMGGMMKQAKKMMDDLKKVQEDLTQERIEVSSGGGMVKATVTGDGELVSVKIDPQVVDPEDVEMLEDLVTTAVKEAVAQAKEHAAEKMEAVTGGLGIPGMF
jgi:DNA-binding YbaB/EbfC family protein